MVVDGHCDVLSKLYMQPSLDFFRDETLLDAGYRQLRRGGIKLQMMALYISERIERPSMRNVLQMIDVYHRRVLCPGIVEPIRTKNDLDKVIAGEQIGTILTLEGVDALEGDLASLQACYKLGVRSVGITWNWANWAADGVLEPRGGGFTRKGRELVEACNRLRLTMDVSHLSERGFWELEELSEVSLIASHSNAKELCPHPRNLDNRQIKAIVRLGGVIGITFVPYFVKKEPPVAIADVLRHIDHIASLGGARSIAFGSDFDGIETWVKGLENAGKYDNMKEELYKYYKAGEVEDFLHGNWMRFWMERLPAEENDQQGINLDMI